jgi:hypothetical protein
MNHQPTLWANFDVASHEHDSNAVGVYTKSGKHLGYVPAFYSKAIFSLIEDGATHLVRVAYINTSLK